VPAFPEIAPVMRDEKVLFPVNVLLSVRSVVLAPLPPAGVAHVPSPRQKVDAEADVPLLRFVTGRLPVTPVERGSPVLLQEGCQ